MPTVVRQSTYAADAGLTGWSVVFVTSRCQGAVRRMRTSLHYSSLTFGSGSEKASPLGESGGTGQLVGVPVLEMALGRKVFVGRGMD